MEAAFLRAVPGKATHLEVQVLDGPGSRNHLLNGKRGHREVGSEGCRRQNAGPTKRNRIRGGHVG